MLANHEETPPRVHLTEKRAGLDHRVGHFRPLKIMAQTPECLVISKVRRFCIAQKQKGVAGAMIEACLFTFGVAPISNKDVRYDEASEDV